MPKFKISGREIADNKQCYIIAEIGNNHNGSKKTAKQLIHAAADSGVDAVKFQTFKADDITSPEILANEFPGWDVTDKYKYWNEFVASFELPYKYYNELIDLTRKLGMAFISTPASLDALHFLVEKNIDAIKISSMDLNNSPFLKAVSLTNFPVILSTGMSTVEEIDKAVDILKISPLCILHCVSTYPLIAEDANLLNIPMLKERYKNNNFPVGFSNHALGYDLDISAVTLGASIIEKHFTLNRNTKKIAEHHFSMEKSEMKEMINKIAVIQESLGDKKRKITERESKNRKMMRRSLHLLHDKKLGEEIHLNDIIAIRPGTGIEPEYADQIIGKIIKRDIKKYSVLNWDDLK